MKLICLIYGLIDPRTGELRYIGYTKNTLQERLSAHLTEARTSTKRTYKNCWLRALLARGLVPQISLLEKTSDPHEAERRWIAEKRAEGCRLANGTDGGRGCLGARWKLTEAQRQAISERACRQKKSPEEIQQMRERARGNKNWLGRHHSEDTKVKIRAARAVQAVEQRRRRELELVLNPPPPKPPYKPRRGMLGRKHTAETKQRWSEKRKGVKCSPEAVAKRAIALQGHIVSAETREKIRLSALARWQLRATTGEIRIGR